MEGEIEIHYEPFRELIIMQYAKFQTIEELARFTAILAGGKPSGLYWASGVAFLYFPLVSTTDAVAREIIENKRIYWTFVGYAPLPEYRTHIETKERAIIPVINLNSNQFFRKVAEWLKQR